LLDVAIIGAGPTGSRVAYQLALLGHSVCVLEKKSAAGQKVCCTGIISQECYNKYNIPDRVVYRGIKSAKLVAPSGNYINIFRPEVQAYVINRSAFDQDLANRATEKGAQFIFNTVVEDVNFSENGAVLDCISKDRYLRIESRFVVMACGFGSALSKRLNLGKYRYFTTGVQLEVKTKKLDGVEIYFGNEVAPGFFAWLVPTQEGNALAGLMSRYSAGYYLRRWISNLIFKNKIQNEIGNIKYCGIPMYPLARTYRERLLIVGDAAGQVKPTTGGGIYFGLLCADIAAETLHNTMGKQQFSSVYLSSYEQRWHMVLRKELRHEYMARWLYQRLSDRQINMIFNNKGIKDSIDEILRTNKISFDWHGNTFSKMIGPVISAIITGSTHRLHKI
jgi:digeranylgeranylglycerophospholipid reductase